MSEDLTRRDFVRRTALGCIAVCRLAGCAKNGAPDNNETGKFSANAVKNADGTFTVKGVGNLAAGEVRAFTLPDGAPAVLVSPAAGKLIALSAKCTHAGCEVAWRADENDFHCPCHNSKFTIDGKVISGPAKEPLPRYDVKMAGDDAIVTVKA